MYYDDRHILAVHRGLLQDTVRTGAYAEAIARTVKPDDVVLDLGSGSGVLALLACRAGARRVYAIEQGHMADVAVMLARANDCGDRVELFHQRSYDVELPERATVLITETLGNIAFDEEILKSVIDARKRLLAPDARLIPARVALAGAPVEVAADYEREVASWSRPLYGFDFSLARTFAANQVRVIDLAESALLAPATQLLEVDLATVESPAVAGGARFTIAHDGLMHGFGAWFVATIADGILLTNGPPLQTPNWRQAMLPLEEPVAVARGDEVRLEIDSADGVNWRWKGAIGGKAFDQTTLFGFAPCRAPG
jgi:protein arginine N-methyltransferase 1